MFSSINGFTSSRQCYCWRTITTLALNAIWWGQTAAVQSDQTARTVAGTGNPAVQVVCYVAVLVDRSALAVVGRTGFIWETASQKRQRRTKSYHFWYPNGRLAESSQFGLRKWKQETENRDRKLLERKKIKIFFLEKKRNRIKREKGIWEMYRKTQIERRELMNWRSLGEKIKSGKGGDWKEKQKFAAIGKDHKNRKESPPPKKNTKEWTVGGKKVLKDGWM